MIASLEKITLTKKSPLWAHWCKRWDIDPFVSHNEIGISTGAIIQYFRGKRRPSALVASYLEAWLRAQAAHHGIVEPPPRVRPYHEQSYFAAYWEHNLPKTPNVINIAKHSKTSRIVLAHMLYRLRIWHPAPPPSVLEDKNFIPTIGFNYTAALVYYYGNVYPKLAKELLSKLEELSRVE